MYMYVSSLDDLKETAHAPKGKSYLGTCTPVHSQLCPKELQTWRYYETPIQVATRH